MYIYIYIHIVVIVVIGDWGDTWEYLVCDYHRGYYGNWYTMLDIIMSLYLYIPDIPITVVFVTVGITSCNQ